MHYSISPPDCFLIFFVFLIFVVVSGCVSSSLGLFCVLWVIIGSIYLTFCPITKQLHNVYFSLVFCEAQRTKDALQRVETIWGDFCMNKKNADHL
jgi:hypothetical protein